MTRRDARYAVVGLAIIAAAALAVGLVAATGGASSGPTAARYFSALRRPLNTRDRGLTTNVHFQHFASGQQKEWQADPAQARVVNDENRALVALMPNGKGGLCVTAIVSGGDGTLNSESGLCGPGPQGTPGMDDTPILVRAGLKGAGPWLGVLPDGVSQFRAVYSDGTEGLLRLTPDRAFAFVPPKAVSSFKFVDSAGSEHSWPVGGPPHG